MLRITLLAAVLGLALCRVPISKRVIPGFERSTAGSFRTTLDERTFCDNGTSTEVVAGRGNTTQEVAELMVLMEEDEFDAYLVPSADAHLSEYTANADKRREFITDFTGSAGTAVILGDGQRAVWVDGRYFVQADQQLDCTWILMKGGEPGVPTISEWLLQELPVGSNVAADARLFTSSYWLSLEDDLSVSSITLEVEKIDDGLNIVDQVWAKYDRPPYSTDELFIHAMEFTGQDWRDKILEVEVEMNSYGAQAYIVSMLDESAWLFNLRCNDVPYNPVFRSYVLFDGSRSPPLVKLFIADIDLKITTEVEEDHLATDNCNATDPCVRIVDYDSIGTEIQNLVGQSFVDTVMVPNSASYYIYNLVPEEKRLMVASPILLEKAQKNPVEQDAMKNSQIKDATALYQFLNKLEPEIKAGANYTEITAMELLDSYRFAQPDNMGLSFETISAFGPNAAIIHYTPTEATDAIITGQNVYLLDSGGQYLDGTTDVTRTFHFGNPTATMIEAYTRVLMGQIDLATVVFPQGTEKYIVDILTRRYLYEVGWDFNHGPTHGVGLYLNIHESSGSTWEAGWHGTDEPGYYEDGNFGIRLESMLAVINVTTKYSFVPVSFGFETQTLFHYETNLIDTTLLTKYHCGYVNRLYEHIQTIMGPHLQNESLFDEYDYMINKTQPLC